MQVWRLLAVGSLVLASLSLALPAHAQESSSEHYEALEQTNVGGNASSSSNFKAFGTVNYYPSHIFGTDPSGGGPDVIVPPDPDVEETEVVVPPDQTPEPITPGLAQSDAGIDESTPTVSLARPIRILLTALTSASLNESVGTIAIVGTLALGTLPAAAAGLGAAVPIAQPLAYLFNGLVGWTKRRRGYGVVYDAQSRRPIQGATVRLLAEGGSKFAAGKLVGTTTTDAQGRYRFESEPGQYRIEVVASQFTFPSKQSILGYQGEHLTTESGGSLHPDIPLDGKTVAAAQHRLSLARLGRLIQWLRIPLMVLGSGVAIYFVATRLATIDLLVLIAYGLLWLLELLSWVRAHQEARVLSDTKPVDSAIVRLLDQSKQLRDTVVTQPDGTFVLFAPSGRYVLDIVKEGYRQVRQQFQMSRAGKLTLTVQLTTGRPSAVALDRP